MKIGFGKFELHIGNLVFVVLPLLFLTGLLAEYLVAFVSIALHEFGHMAAAMARGCRPARMNVTPLGLSVVLDEKELTKSDSLLIFSAGPAVNILLAVLWRIAAHILDLPPGRSFFFSTNLCLAVFNLIPAIPLDGGRILWELLAGRTGYRLAGKISRIAAFVLSAALIAAGLSGIAGGGVNFSLSLAGLYIMLLLYSGKMEAALMNIKQIVFRRSRLIKKGIYPARDLVAMKSTPVSEILKDMDYDRFHFVYVLDDNLKLIGIVNESELMDSLTGGSPGITFGELLGTMGKGRLIDI